MENFQFGTILIRDHMKSQALEIGHDTIVASQLGSLTEAALLEKLEVEFYAVNALRFVVGALKNPPGLQPTMATLIPFWNIPGLSDIIFMSRIEVV